jgi:hypothetical protein
MMVSINTFLRHQYFYKIIINKIKMFACKQTKYIACKISINIYTFL